MNAPPRGAAGRPVGPPTVTFRAPEALDRAMLIPELSRLAKALAEGVLIGVGVIAYHVGLAPILINRDRGRVRVLMYHACEERETDFLRGLSINTRPARLAAQLDFLRDHYRIIPLEALGPRAIPERALVITFDDGFRSVHENAMPVLAARNLPATCYLVTDRLDDRSPIWINELNAFLRRNRAAATAIICAGCNSTADARCPSSSVQSSPVTTPPSSPTC